MAPCWHLRWNYSETRDLQMQDLAWLGWGVHPVIGCIRWNDHLMALVGWSRQAVAGLYDPSEVPSRKITVDFHMFGSRYHLSYLLRIAANGESSIEWKSSSVWLSDASVSSCFKHGEKMWFRLPLLAGVSARSILTWRVKTKYGAIIMISANKSSFLSLYSDPNQCADIIVSF